MSVSWRGSQDSALEAISLWCLGDGGANPAAPLSNAPSEDRKKFYDFLMMWGGHTCFRHGGCFALRKDGKIVATVATIPPNDKKLHVQGICQQMAIMGEIVIFSSPPKELKEARFVEVGKVMKKAHDEIVPGRHLYVYAFATLSGSQGKGYGRELMQFFGDAAGLCSTLMRNTRVFISQSSIKHLYLVSSHF